MERDSAANMNGRGPDGASAVTVILTGGLTLDLQMEFAALRDALQEARTERRDLQIRDRRGATFLVNPEHVVYVKAPAAESAAAANGASSRLGALPTARAASAP